jgi:hypothetical protein
MVVLVKALGAGNINPYLKLMSIFNLDGMFPQAQDHWDL